MKTRTRRWTLRAAVVTSLVVGALPAGAAVFVQNFMKADISRNAACVTKIAGADNAASIVTTNVTATGTGIGGTTILNESISLKSFAGDRTIVTDSIRIKNTCATAMNVFLKAEPGIAATTTSGAWTGLAVNIYLGSSSIVSASPLNAAVSGTDFTTGWNATPISITPSATGTVATSTTGTVSIPANSEVQIGVLADASSSAPTTGTATVNFTVNATP